MKISARNVFDGTIEAVKPGAINSEVDIALPGGLKIVATVTNDSITELGIDCQLSDKLVLDRASGCHEHTYILRYTTKRNVHQQIAGHQCCTALWLRAPTARA